MREKIKNLLLDLYVEPFFAHLLSLVTAAHQMVTAQLFFPEYPTCNLVSEECEVDEFSIAISNDFNDFCTN